MTFKTVTISPAFQQLLREGPAMTEETATRSRRKNPLVEYERAKAFADKARRASARAADLADKARVASEKADVLSAQKDDAERAEQGALDALQGYLSTLKGADTADLDEYDEGDGE